MAEFSIIVPTYRRPSLLSDCLHSLAALAFERDRFEVIVVDDGSGAPPEAVVNAASRDLRVRLLCRPHQGPAAARNAGAALAVGRYLAFTDDDCRPAPGWLAALAGRFARNGECVAGGRSLNAIGGNVYSEASQALLDYLYGYFNADAEDARLLISNNLAMPAEVFRAAGGFDTGFPNAAAEDRELCDRLRHLGVRLVYEPGAVVMHHHELSWRRFWRQHQNYGSGAFRYHRVRARRSGTGLRLEPVSFYRNLLACPFAADRPQALTLSALLAVSQAANATGFFQQRIQSAFSGSPL